MNRRPFLRSAATTSAALPLHAADFGFGSLNCDGADPKLICNRAADMTRQLYNLADDPKEPINVIDSNREVAARLEDLLSTQRAKGQSRKP